MCSDVWHCVIVDPYLSTDRSVGLSLSDNECVPVCVIVVPDLSTDRSVGLSLSDNECVPMCGIV